MGKVKLLLDVIEDIRSLADSLEAVADAMTRSDSPDTKAEEPKAPAPKAVEETPTPVTKALGKEQLRAFLGEKTFAEVLSGLVIKPQGKPTLVPASDKRPAIHTGANHDFTEITEE